MKPSVFDDEDNSTFDGSKLAVVAEDTARCAKLTPRPFETADTAAGDAATGEDKTSRTIPLATEILFEIFFTV